MTIVEEMCGGNDNLFESNVIEHTNYECDDSGSFYTCGQQGAIDSYTTAWCLQSLRLLQVPLSPADTVCWSGWVLDKAPRSLTAATFCATIRSDASGRRCVWPSVIGMGWPDTVLLLLAAGQDISRLPVSTGNLLRLALHPATLQYIILQRVLQTRILSNDISLHWCVGIRRSDEWVAHRREYCDRCSNGYHGWRRERHGREGQ